MKEAIISVRTRFDPVLTPGSARIRLNNDYTNHKPVWFVYRELEPRALTDFIAELYTEFQAPVNFGPPGPVPRLAGFQAFSPLRPLREQAVDGVAGRVVGRD